MVANRRDCARMKLELDDGDVALWGRLAASAMRARELGRGEGMGRGRWAGLGNRNVLKCGIQPKMNYEILIRFPF